MKPTEEQIKKFWEKCEVSTLYELWPPIDLNNLFKWGVPVAIKALENRFDSKTNKIRGLELIFQHWIDKIREGFTIEDALFRALYEVLEVEK